MNDLIRIGMDTSKSVFQLHGVDGGEQPVLCRKLRRRQVLAHRAHQAQAQEAGGGGTANKTARIAWKLMVSGERYDARRMGAAPKGLAARAMSQAA